MKNIFQSLRIRFFKMFNLLKLKRAMGRDYSLGKNITIYTSFYLDICKGSKIEIGDNFTLISGEGFNPLSRNQKAAIVTSTPEALISIGNNVGMSSPCIWAKDKIIIGDYVNIGGDCILMDCDIHNLDWKIRDSGEMTPKGISLDLDSAKRAPIVIGKHVLIGTKSIILKGVTIGDNSVIAAGSVVTKNIPPNCIAGGNPAKVLKYFE